MTVKEEENLNIKCVVVGDGGVGKTSIILRYVNGRFMEDYLPTCFDNYAVQIQVQDKLINVDLIDTAGQETYDRLRTLSYFNTDVFIVCFSLVDNDSYINVKHRWIPELKEYQPGIPIILVGTKKDLREGSGSGHIPPSKGKKLCRKVSGHGYFECSAVTQVGLQDIFTQASTVALGLQPKKPIWKSFKKFFRLHKMRKST